MRAEGRGLEKVGSLIGQMLRRRGVGSDRARGEEPWAKEDGSGRQDWEDPHHDHRLVKRWKYGWMDQ